MVNYISMSLRHNTCLHSLLLADSALLPAETDPALLPAETAVFTAAGSSAGSSATAAGSAVAMSNPSSLAAALSSLSKASSEIWLGRGIPTLPKKVVERILSWEFVDFNDLPPARSTKPLSSIPPNVLLIQSVDSITGQKKLIPDLTTWMQCFTIYASVLATKHPQYLPEMLAYSRDIIRASRQFKWPSWVIYDTLYRRHMAEIGQHDWSKVDPSIYARCFTGWAKSPSWCVICVTLDHDTADCPYASSQERRARRPSPYPSYASNSSSHRPSPKGQVPICIKYNKYNGDCRHGESCKFRHVCSQCQGAHPRAQCKQERSQAPKDN